MEHANILMRYDMDCIRIDIPDFDEVRFKCKYPRVGECEALRLTFPINSPIRSSSPTIAVNEERELGIIEEEFAIESLNVYWSNAFFSCNEV